jgi:MFS family permease
MHGAAAPASTSSSTRHAMLVLICTSVPSFMLQLDANIVSVSLPVIARSLNASFAGIEWVITAYMLSFASLLLPAGALADRFGRKPLLVIGLSGLGCLGDGAFHRPGRWDCGARGSPVR